MHFKKECESNDRLIHFVESSNVHNSDLEGPTLLNRTFRRAAERFHKPGEPEKVPTFENS